MFDSAEILRNIVDNLHRHFAPNGGYGGEVVFYIVHTGDFYIRFWEKLRYLAVLAVAEHSVLAQERAVFHRLCVRKPAQLAAHKFRHACGYNVVGVEYGYGKSVLVAKYVALCLNVFLHILMNVKVVRRNVGHNGNIRRAAHGYKLKA